MKLRLLWLELRINLADRRNRWQMQRALGALLGVSPRQVGRRRRNT